MGKHEIQALRDQLNDIYADYRNIALSQKYYECRFSQTERFNFWYEVIIAIGTSGTVAGWAFWKFPVADIVWPIFGGVVATLSIIKPIVGLGQQIERFTALATYYSSLRIDFQLLIFEIKRKKDIDEIDHKNYCELKNKLKTLPAKEVLNPSVRTLSKLKERVNSEIQVNNLWNPK